MAPTIRPQGSLEATSDPSIPEGVTREFIGLSAPTAKRMLHGQHPVSGLYWSKQGVQPSVVFVMAHYNADFSEHYMAPDLAKRGYGVVGLNTRFTGAEDQFNLDKGVEDIEVGLQWIKDHVAPKHIILVGNSGGGSLMAAFAVMSAEKKWPVLADGFVFLNAHMGRADVMTLLLDPAVVDELDPVKTDASLDMFNKEHGPPYSEAFITKYRAAQVARNHKITAWAKKELQRLNDAGIPDRVFPLYRNFADLRFMDGNIEPSDRPIPACMYGDPADANLGIPLHGRSVSLKAWISMFSLEDSQARVKILGPRFTLPTLVIQGTRDVGISPVDAKTIYDSLASKDKELLLVPGSHFFEEGPEVLENAVEKILAWVKPRYS